MKQYRRDVKKHMDDEEYAAYKAKKSGKLCRGGRPHDFVLVLPFHVSYNDKYKFNPEEYYKLKDAMYAFEEETDKKLEEMGVVSRYHRYSSLFRTETRYFMCSVCKKHKYGE